MLQIQQNGKKVWWKQLLKKQHSGKAVISHTAPPSSTSWTAWQHCTSCLHHPKHDRKRGIKTCGVEALLLKHSNSAWLPLLHILCTLDNLCNFLKPTIQTSQPLYAAIGQVCGCMKVGREAVAHVKVSLGKSCLKVIPICTVHHLSRLWRHTKVTDKVLGRITGVTRQCRNILGTVCECMQISMQNIAVICLVYDSVIMIQRTTRDRQTDRQTERVREHPRAWSKTNIRLRVRVREAVMKGGKVKRSCRRQMVLEWRYRETEAMRLREGREKWKKDLNFFSLEL